MSISSQAWFVAWYRAALFLWASFKYGEEYKRDDFIERHSRQTNLCFFVRTMLVWGPLALAAQLAVYGFAATVLLYSPVYFFGGAAVGKLVTFLVVGGLLVAGTVWVGSWIHDAVKRRGPQVRVAEEGPKAPGILDVIVEWILARKAKICPSITFTGAR